MLHDCAAERGACGIGFVADAAGVRSRVVLDRALEGLRRVEHRGATAGDGSTGDGAGVLLPIPEALVPEPGCGLAMVFARSPAAVEGIEAACAAEGLSVRSWRHVPVDASALGPEAAATAPEILQAVLDPPRGTLEEAELRAYRARRRVSTLVGAYVASLSFRTITYKALCSAAQLERFYADLRAPEVEVALAVFHQRFSTNTMPSWERAQPFRLLCHNGEINAIAGNVNSMRAREASAVPELGPVIEPRGSDSAMLDNALEVLVRAGRDIRHAVSMLIPEAWEGNSELEPAVRDFYRYHSTLVEPWDGPAAVVFTDGSIVGAALDRNGLRPLRTAVSDERLVAACSEAGAIELPGRVRQGRLGPGQMVAVDPARGFEDDSSLKRRLAGRRPYGAWSRALVPLEAGEPVRTSTGELTRRQAAFGYTREELSLLVRPLAAGAHDAVSSMGDDTALPPLASLDRPLYSYFRQRFAQVTNPPIDHLRERHVFTLRTLLGPRASLVSEGPWATRLLELQSFFLFPSAVEALNARRLRATFERGLAAACEGLADEAEAAVAVGAPILVLDDGGSSAPIPALLAVGAVQHRLLRSGLRSRTSIVVLSDEPRETHHFACLLGYGADAVCPRLALETVAALAEADKLGGDRPSPAEAQLRFQQGIEDGVLKVMSKMGISDVASYRGAQLFEAIGLGHEVVDRYFTGTPCPVGGIGFAEIEADVLARAASGELANPGYVKFRKGGEGHATSPEVVAAAHALRKSGNDRAEYERFAELVDARPPLELRDLLELSPAGPPVPVEQVESAAAIVRRFSSGAMSHGSLSREAHETVARALNLIGARSNSGEGGEDPARFRGDANSRIKQVASARFGVTPEYLASADELQIKIAQGSKPGEGGQLPGGKVTAEIAALRHSQPGIALISPPPHHDIYSIEDLAQLVFDLRQANPHALVSVKLVAEAGIGVVASGVAKALADIVHVAGADGGTGASPLTSIKNAGAPWELGLAEAQQALVANGLRGRVRIRADGGFKTGRDVIVAALLGADEVSFGTALLLAQGCLMVRTCHLDTCPVGIATQRPELRAKFAATPDEVASYLLHVADDVRRRLAELGLRSFDDAIGRTDLLRPRAIEGHAARLDLKCLLDSQPGERRYLGRPIPVAAGGELGERLAADALPALEGAALVEPAYTITNADRAVGARLSGQIATRFGSDKPPGRVRARFAGAAGQSFGAFLAAGVELDLEGQANDYVGKGMAGGRIVVRPPQVDEPGQVLLGNTVLYGATGGELYCAGRAGERFAVRNSGAVAVVEGIGEHGCEYMTNGTVAVLGPVGRNFGAGMTGGEAYVYDPAGVLSVRLNDELVTATPIGRTDTLRSLLERHLRYTSSPLAAELLERWDVASYRFLRVAPRAEAAGLENAHEAGR
jgi:glutamate synthase domain-containing protein 2/glutamate synthase domain-containing protein 1/glutamate synthase domain-containing protein 3